MKRTVAALALAIIAPLTAAPSAHAEAIGYEGCTPGYWKNHTDSWADADGADPTYAITSSWIFPEAAPYLSGTTMLQALGLKGGPGVAGAARILARAATAAYLNAAHEGLGYPWRRMKTGLDGRPPLLATVNAAFASGDRDTMIALASRLDADNNLGCPLS